MYSEQSTKIFVVGLFFFSNFILQLATIYPFICLFLSIESSTTVRIQYTAEKKKKSRNQKKRRVVTSDDNRRGLTTKLSSKKIVQKKKSHFTQLIGIVEKKKKKQIFNDEIQMMMKNYSF